MALDHSPGQVWAMMSQSWHAPGMSLEMAHTSPHLTSYTLFSLFVPKSCQAPSITLTLIFALCSLSHSQLPNH